MTEERGKTENWKLCRKKNWKRGVEKRKRKREKPKEQKKKDPDCK